MKELQFTVDSALLSELGERLVETVHVSLVELVKNAYDADATKVTIKFGKDTAGKFQIQIIDNGTGMTLTDIQNYWMRIATTNKLKNNTSQIYGRPKTGAKGIGRFCCRRLGNSLRLISTASVQRGYEKTDVLFQWDKFIAGTDVTSIKCPGESIISKEGESGTTLIIKGCNEDEWTRRGYNYLMRQLAILTANRGVKRPGFKEDPGFNILLDAPNLEGEVIDLREKLISAGWGTIEGYVNKKGQAVYKLNAMGLGEKEFKSQKVYSDLEGVKFMMGVLVDDREQMRDKSIVSKSTLQEILPEWGGVQVRYRGFRVYPYGSEGDDWLDIDRDRGLRRAISKDEEIFNFAKSLRNIDPSRALLQMLSMRSHVGTVEIDVTAPDAFMMKANREGFVHSEAVTELKRFVRSGIDWATIYRDYYISAKKKTEVQKVRKAFEEQVGGKVSSDVLVDSAVGYIQKELENISDFIPKDDKKEIKRKFRTAIEAIVTKEKADKEEMQHLRLVASTSTLTLLFAHEVKSLLGGLDSNIANLESIQNKLTPKDAKLVQEVCRDLDSAKSRFSDLLQMTSIIGTESKKERPQRLALVERLENSVKCFQLITKAYNLSIDYSKVPNNTVVGPLLEAELYAIILNLLSNSIKSVIAAGGEKMILISANVVDKKNVICFRDTGIGLDASYYEDVFIPFVADPGGNLYNRLDKNLNLQDKYIVGSGSGLGLSIVKEIIESRRGSIKFCPPDGKWKAKLEVILP